MNLENKTLGTSSTLKLEIVDIKKISDYGEIGYEIFFENENSRLKAIYIGKDGKNFVKRLIKEDKLLIITEGDRCLAVYGRLEEDKFYNFER